MFTPRHHKYKDDCLTEALYLTDREKLIIRKMLSRANDQDATGDIRSKIRKTIDLSDSRQVQFNTSDNEYFEPMKSRKQKVRSKKTKKRAKKKKVVKKTPLQWERHFNELNR
jgi:hypothetical protein